MAGSFFHEVNQNQKIGQAKADAQNAQRTAENAQDAMRRLEKKVESLTNLSQALWKILKEKANLNEEDLLRVYQEVESGPEKGVQPCSNCNRPVGRSQTRCMYCGTEKTITSIFDTL